MSNKVQNHQRLPRMTPIMSVGMERLQGPAWQYGPRMPILNMFIACVSHRG